MGLPSYSDELRSGADEAFAARSDTREVRSHGDAPRIPGPARVPFEAMGLPTKSGPVTVMNDRESSAVVAKTPSLPPPIARFGRYDVLGRLAVGGMAEIYLGHEAVEGGAQRHVAIKVLRQQGAVEARAGARERNDAQTRAGVRARSDVAQTQDEAYFEELFLREGRTAAQLVHPNICHTYAFGKWGGHFFIALEWVDGVSLGQVLNKLSSRGQALDPFIAASIAAQVAGALEYAHRARDTRRRPLGIVHRDVNPQNIMLRYDGVVKLLDFGVAQVEEPHGDSRSDTVKGKLGYMAPEQLRQQRLDARADVFALGVCLYEMLTGTRLYKRDSMRETVEAVLEEPVPVLSTLTPALSAEFDRVLQRALAKEARARFESAGELQAALESFLARSGEIASARRISALMDGLYPESRRESVAASLFTGPDVAERLAAIEAEGELEPAGALAAPTAPPTRGLSKQIVLILVALATVAALSWAWPRAEPPLAPGSALTPVSAPGLGSSAAGSSGAALRPGSSSAEGAAPGSAPASGSTSASGAAAAAGSTGGAARAPAPGSTSGAALAPARASALAPASAPVRPAVDARHDATSAGKPEDHLAKRRRKSPGFVADPGF